MFGAIVAGRPVSTDLQAISSTQFAFNIPSRPPFHHIVVFILPGQTLPDGAAAGVYIQIPPSTSFSFLGALANGKQSAIFKVNAGNAAAPTDDVMLDDSTLQPVTEPLSGSTIVLGISLEPIASIEAQLAQLKSGASSQALVRAAPSAQRTVSTKVLAQRIIQNAFNFLSSFATGAGGNETVPLKAFHDWWNKFEKRIELDPSFLENAQGS